MLHLLKKAFLKTVPVLAGYIFLGIAYGISMKENGFGVGLSALISTVVFGGSMQFAMIETMKGAFAPLTIALLALLIQARHIFYGLSMLEKYSATGRYKPYLIFALTDETYSLVCNGAPAGVHAGKWYTLVSALDQCYWVIGSVIGAVLGQLIPVDALTGIDFAMTALFTVIVTEQTMDSIAKVKAGAISKLEAIFSPALGGAATLVSLLLIGRSNFLLMSMGLMLSAFLARWFLAERRRFE